MRYYLALLGSDMSSPSEDGICLRYTANPQNSPCSFRGTPDATARYVLARRGREKTTFAKQIYRKAKPYIVL